MKSNYMNYFKEGKCYQWDKDKNVISITPTEIKEEFCLDKNGMDMFLKFDNPEIKVGKSLEVKSGKTKANIKLCEQELVLPNMEYTSSFKLDINKLKTANKFVSTNLKRPVLTGVNISNGYIAGTDSYFIYRETCETDCNITIASQFINILNDAQSDIEIKCNDGVVCCDINGITYIGRLLSGAFPNVEKLYNTPANRVVVNKEELKQLLSFSETKESNIILSNNKLVIEGENVFEAEIDLDINCEICLSLSRILTVINCIQEKELTIGYDDGLHPIYINDNYLLCPVRRG